MKILVGYDGSECAEAALQDLKHAGLAAEVDVLVMSLADVFVPPPLDDEVDKTYRVYETEGIKRAHERAQHKLDQAEGWRSVQVNKSDHCFRTGTFDTRHRRIRRHGRSFARRINGRPN